MRNPAGDGIEHFGYVDGRSQPLFLKDEVDKEPREHWDPAFPLSNVLVADPLAADPDRHFGSYFVFRKLEQNVRAFKEIEQELADDLGLDGRRPRPRGRHARRPVQGRHARHAPRRGGRRHGRQRLHLRRRRGRQVPVQRPRQEDQPALAQPRT